MNLVVADDLLRPQSHTNALYPQGALYVRKDVASRSKVKIASFRKLGSAITGIGAVVHADPEAKGLFNSVGPQPFESVSPTI